MGELHNEGLHDLYNYFIKANISSEEEINTHAISFLKNKYGEEAADYYTKTKNSYNFINDLPLEIQKEIDLLYQNLDNKNFNNIVEFKLYMTNYETTFITTEDNLKAWEVYNNVFTSSFEYWSEEYPNWENLNSNINSSFFITNSSNGWWGRTWNKIKKHVGVDAGAATSYVVVGLITSGPIGIAAGAGASLGASAASVIKDLF